ncbi:NUDIX domain-containing protein [Patescibacteria group bacterium]|nr:NUDIX domain-containing protein [Patescibacteria group bacterium]
MKKVQATCAIIINDQNQFLLIKRGRDPYEGYWAFVSGVGSILKGLPPAEAVIEEVECDLQTTFKGKYLFTLSVDNDEHINETVVFVGKVEESKIKINPPYSQKHQWFTVEQINKVGQLAFEHYDILNRYLTNINKPE